MKSLEKLENHLYRHSDRSVELNSFPRDEWFKLQSKALDIRNSKGYVANRPRPTENLIERLREHNIRNIAVGGIVGARNYMTDINMLGVPRLDITVHLWNESGIADLVRKLDPGLRETAKGELPQVAIHQLNTKNSLFSIKPEIIIADEVSCLLDLHETRLESQAMELLDHLIMKAKS